MRYKIVEKRSLKYNKVRYLFGDIVELPEEPYRHYRWLLPLEGPTVPVIPEPKIYAAPLLPKRRAGGKGKPLEVSVLVGVPCPKDDKYRGWASEVVAAAEASLTEAGVDFETYVTPCLTGERWKSVVDAYDLIFDRFLAGHYEYLWICEADNPPPREAFRKLHSLDVDLASGFYRFHVGGHRKVIVGFLEGLDRRYIKYRCPMRPDQVIGNILEGWVCAGTGCLLIKRRVVESGLRVKWQPPERTGFDVIFLWEACMRGFTTMVHGGVECGHLPEHPLTVSVEAPQTRSSMVPRVAVQAAAVPVEDDSPVSESLDDETIVNVDECRVEESEKR